MHTNIADRVAATAATSNVFRFSPGYVEIMKPGSKGTSLRKFDHSGRPTLKGLI